MPARVSEPTISLRESEQIVDTLNEVLESDADVTARVEFLLNRLRALLKRTGRSGLIVLEDLDRQPAPTVTSRVVVRPDWDRHVPDNQQLQDLWDESPAVASMIVAKVRAHLRVPHTFVGSEDTSDPDWFHTVLLNQALQPIGYADVMISMWAGSPNRALYASLLRTSNEATFSEHDRTLMSLMLRAAAPLVDRELFQSRVDSLPATLTVRQREILSLLLTGDSEKQIAARLHRSIHTVHTHVKLLYDLLEVSSRGELMAMFIDRAVLAAASPAST